MNDLIINNDEDLDLLQLIENRNLAGDGAVPANLLRESGMSRGKFYRVLGVYEDKELIKRKRCNLDLRMTKVFITPKGKDAISWWGSFFQKVQKINEQVESDMKQLGLIKDEK
jgi:DNA-binding MarR family transcriptional regulator